ncbi:4665_t:CDS:1, partial [Ambispora gerdemannii]
LELLKQYITELKVENIDLRRKFLMFDAEIAELKYRNIEFLRTNKKYNKRHDVKIKKLKQKNAKLKIRLAVMKKSFMIMDEQSQNDKEAILEMLSE